MWTSCIRFLLLLPFWCIFHSLKWLKSAHHWVNLIKSLFWPHINFLLKSFIINQNYTTTNLFKIQRHNFLLFFPKYTSGKSESRKNTRCDVLKTWNKTTCSPGWHKKKIWYQRKIYAHLLMHLELGLFACSLISDFNEEAATLKGVRQDARPRRLCLQVVD